MIWKIYFSNLYINRCQSWFTDWYTLYFFALAMWYLIQMSVNSSVFLLYIILVLQCVVDSHELAFIGNPVLLHDLLLLVSSLTRIEVFCSVNTYCILLVIFSLPVNKFLLLSIKLKEKNSMFIKLDNNRRTVIYEVLCLLDLLH